MGAAAFFGVVVFVSSLLQNKLNARISAEKDRALAEYQVTADVKIAQAHQLADEARERTAFLERDATSLRIDLERARAATILADARLLNEQRLTANERWRLERLEKAILPRNISPEFVGPLVAALQGLSSVNIAVVNKPEPMNFAFSLMQILNFAHAFGKLIVLPSNSQQSGVAVYTPNLADDRLFNAFWNIARIGGKGIGVRTGGLEDIPKDQECLIVGDNDAALQPGEGQPGEGIDEHGRPVPAPR